MKAKLQQIHKELVGQLRSIERKRSTTLFFQKVMWSLTLAYIVIIFTPMLSSFFPDYFGWASPIVNLVQSESDPYRTLYFYGGVIVVVYPTIFLFGAFLKRFKKEEKAAIKKMIKSLFPKSDFSADSQLSAHKVMASNLFTGINEWDVIHTHGQMRHKMGNTPITISDIGLQEANVKSSFKTILLKIPLINIPVMLYEMVIKNIISQKTADNLVFSYRGMFTRVDFPIRFTGQTVLLYNTLEAKANRVLRREFSSDTAVLLEDPRFTKDFSVFSTDQVEARYLLSSSVMEKIADLKSKVDRPMMLSFIGGEIFVAIENKDGLFSFPAGKDITEKVLEEMYEMISTCYGVVDELINKGHKPKP